MEFGYVADTDNGSAVEPGGEWLTPTTKYHLLKNTGKLKKKMPEKFLTKPYETLAVESPHPGGFLIDTFTVGMKTFAFPL